MFGLGFSEILVIAVIAIVFIGPDQLPDLARTIGRFLNDLKRSTDSLKDDFRNQIQIDFEERKKEIFTEVQPHSPETSDPVYSTVSPHETDPMLSQRQEELHHMEHASETTAHTTESNHGNIAHHTDTPPVINNEHGHTADDKKVNQS